MFRSSAGRPAHRVCRHRAGRFRAPLRLAAAVIGSALAFAGELAPPAAGAAPASDAPAAGVTRALARERAARLRDVRYRLAFRLNPGAGTAPAREELSFTLRDDAAPLWLDFRDGTLAAVSVNGAPAAAVFVNGHLRLPAAQLRRGSNQVVIEFAPRIAPAGAALTRFTDPEDHSEYLYTLFVPMDASMAFPCFDQPDLKARFELELDAPAQWVAISNTQITATQPLADGRQRTRFAVTPPISTYVFAFAAGPFGKVATAAGAPGLYVRRSKLDRAAAEATEVSQIAAQGISYLSAFFARPFPFTKYDMVLIPGFPYGGMEHAGATFLSEEAVLFRRAPTQRTRFHRDILVLHELVHQWFGDLVTMRWFDDLWLKEGFAQYMAYQTLAELHPQDQVWKRFYEDIKPTAYAIDSTTGTTPIYQDIPNLRDAKSAYGAIVYYKAPGVLKQLAYVLGADRFRDGLRLYLRKNAYGNAEWHDLVLALQNVSGTDLTRWAQMWIRQRGMPEVAAQWSCADGRVDRLLLTQNDVLGGADTWPITLQVLLAYADAEPVRLRVALNARSTDVAPAHGARCPAYVFANDGDHAYGRFLLDPASQAAVDAAIGKIGDPFTRALLLGSTWDAVRQRKLAPRRYLELAGGLVPGEQDEAISQSLYSHATVALHDYVATDVSAGLAPHFEASALEQMSRAVDPDLRIVAFRALAVLAQTPLGLDGLKQLLSGARTVPGVELRPLDRWSIVTNLIAFGDPEAGALLASEAARQPGGDSDKYVYMAKAASADTATKRWYFDDFLNNRERPEDWIEGSLGAFNYWNQAPLTEPYLRPALRALGQLKAQRKIFFVVDWLDAFLSGQRSATAQATVDEFLAGDGTDADLKLKILQAKDELDRTVAIRAAYPD